MKILILPLFMLFTLSSYAQTASVKLDCLVGESVLKKDDFSIDKLRNKDDFFSRVAVNTINTIIKNKPFDQDGVMFSLMLGADAKPKLQGYFLVKERLDQLDLSTATCRTLKGNKFGFTFSCNVKNPNDQQKVVLNFLYKFNLKVGVLDLKVSNSDLGYLTKNKFSCMSSQSTL